MGLNEYFFSFRAILEGSFSSCLQVLKLNQCDGINDAAIERTVLSFLIHASRKLLNRILLTSSATVKGMYGLQC